MRNKLTVEISEGLGNQMFMYAHAYALAKRLNYDLFIDDKSGYSKNKNLLRKHQKFMLDNFCLEGYAVNNDFIYNTRLKRFKKNIKILLDFFFKRKNFFIEKNYIKNSKKFAFDYLELNPNKISNNLYVQGNFENSKYFENYKNNLQKIFTLKKKNINKDNLLINELIETNSISIHIRRNRFSDQTNMTSNKNIKESENFTNLIIEYINRSIDYFNNKISTPKYFIWSNDHTNIQNIINNVNATYPTLINNDALNDFNLFKYCKHFIVGPSSYHWWGAWLNENPDKICVRPKNINPSNNVNFWPKDWISI